MSGVSLLDDARVSLRPHSILTHSEADIAMEKVSTRIERAARAAFLNAWTRGGQMRSAGEKRWDDPKRLNDPWRQNWIDDTSVAIEEFMQTSQ